MIEFLGIEIKFIEYKEIIDLKNFCLKNDKLFRINIENYFFFLNIIHSLLQIANARQKNVEVDVNAMQTATAHANQRMVATKDAAQNRPIGKCQ